MEKEIREMQEAIGCDAASVWLLEDDCVRPYIFAGPKGQLLEGLELQPGEGVCGYCIENSAEFIYNDMSQAPHWYRQADVKTEYETRNMICLPIIINDECIGCIQLINKDGDFVETDIERCREMVKLLVEEL